MKHLLIISKPTSDGTLFEGRGFSREGEMSFDRFGTSYNTDAISINVFHCYSENSLQDQLKRLRDFLDGSIRTKNLSPSYKIFYHDQIIQSKQIDKSFREALRFFPNYENGKLRRKKKFHNCLVILFTIFSTTNRIQGCQSHRRGAV